MVKKILTSLFLRCISLGGLLVAIDRLLVVRALECSSVGENVFFGKKSSVINSGERTRIQILDGTIVDGQLKVFNNCGSIVIGENSYIGENSKIWSARSVEIGNNVLISHGVNICDSNCHEVDAGERAIGFENQKKFGERINENKVKSESIIIEDDVWINMNCIIMRGVRIGARSIIGAGSIVVKDVPVDSLVVGQAAKIHSKIT